MNNQPYPNYGPQMPPPYQPGAAYAPNQAAQPYQNRNILFCNDGKYRWIYELKMMKNPVVFVTLFKIFGFIFLAVWLFGSIHELTDGNGWDAVWGFTKVLLIVFAGFIVLILLAYTLVAAMNGWKYIVLFEMDEHGVLHRQLKQQVNRAKALGWLTVFVGAASGNLATVGAGINAATKEEMYSDFSKVRSVKPKRGWNTIKVNEMLNKNQVYVEKEDFDFVYQFILAHCPRVKRN